MLRKPKKAFLALLVIFILLSSTYAFANANTIQKSNLGFKASPVTGYAISNIAYNLDNDDPTLLSTITFNIVPIAPNDRPPLLLAISTARTAEVVENLTANPPISAIAAAPADWEDWSCGISGASPTWVGTCVVADPGIDVGLVYSLDVVVSSSLDNATDPY